MSIRVTVTDTETGDSETREITNDYIVVVAGNRYVHHVNSFANGTAVVTIKAERTDG